MKLKLSIGVALVVAVIAGLCMWLFRKAAPAAKSPVAATVMSRPKAAAPPSLPWVALHPVRMATIPGESALSPQKVNNPSSTAWPDIQIIIDGNAEFRERFNAINRLPARLTDTGWEELRQFLLKPYPADVDQLNQAVKNRLMDVLCAMQPSPAELSGLLAVIYGDHSQNEVVRDYALQHLATLAEGLAGMKGTDVMRAEKADQAVLWEALDETGDSIAGTALLGLAGLVRAGAPVEQDRLAQAALRLANNGGAGELTHITAYQVCGGLNIQAALPTIETAAQGSPTLSQQISAIGALGMLGGTTDIRLLQALLEGHEERLKPAVRLALDRIAARQNQAVNR